jgi:hypothetical protein
MEASLLNDEMLLVLSQADGTRAAVRALALRGMYSGVLPTYDGRVHVLHRQL